MKEPPKKNLPRLEAGAGGGLESAEVLEESKARFGGLLRGSVKGSFKCSCKGSLRGSFKGSFNGSFKGSLEGLRI